jgi:cell division transport system ATP-binding protein
MPEILLKLEDVHIFQKDKPILTNVNLEVKSGDFCFLIGSTGSGKSSLLKTLYGELPLKNGEATVVDFDLGKLKTKQIPYLRRKLGIVFQDFQLLTDRNVFDNLKFVLRATGWKDKQKIKKRIDKVLSQVAMLEKAQSFPYQISGGEQQRVAIARALLNEPELVLADEPTGNLDPETSKDIMKLFHEINLKGQTVIMATHDYAQILHFPGTIYRCEGGKLFEVELERN